ncbi:AAA family ATPase [Streptomyces sp. NPDC051776]|uniref:helix-turn-helix transcriptional regulator n=1 Tax=Streptomyces sp. NPDC051776 TaxID=3155414 RepID=UPI003447363F
MATTGLAGRSLEMQELEFAIARASSGLGRAVLLEGEPGIGKTALLRAAAFRARETGLRVLFGSAEELEQRLPLAAIGRCLGIDTAWADPQLRALARQIRGEGRPDVIPGREADFAKVEAILALLDDWCSQGPVAVLLDDLQWADAGTLTVLHQLGKSLHSLPLVLITAMRPVVGGELVQLRHSLVGRGAVLLEVGPLSEHAISQVARDLLGAPAGPTLLHLLRDATGNPLFVTEILGALERERAIHIADALVETEAGTVPGSLASAIVGRLDWASPEALELLRTASLLGSGFTVAELATVTGKPAADLVPSVLEVVRYGLLRERAERLVFRHDLIRQALYESIPAHAPAHRAVGRALARSGGAVERVAEHLLMGAGPDGEAAAAAEDEVVINWVADHAATLTLRAPSLSVELLQQTLHDVRPGSERAGRLEVLLASALLWAGRAPDVQSQAERALPHLQEPALRSEMYWVLAQADVACGRPDRAVKRAEDALRSGTLSPSQTRQYQAFLSTCLFRLGEFDRAVATAEEVRATVVEHGEYQAMVDSHLTISIVRMFRGDHRGALEAADQGARNTPGQAASTQHLIGLHIIRGRSLFELDRTTEAHQAIAAGLHLGERSGGMLLTLCHATRAEFMFHTGAWDDAWAEAQVGLELPDYLSTPRAIHGLMALIAGFRGDFATADERLAAADAATTSSTTTPYLEYLPHWARELRLESQGDRHEALADLLEGWRRGFGPFRGTGLLSRAADLVRLAIALGEFDTAREVVAEVDPRDDAEAATPRAQAIRTHCRGLFEGDPAILASAADYFREAPWLLARGQYLEDYAAVLAAAGSLEEARTELDQALDVYGQLRAEWSISCAEERLEAAGLPRRRSDRRRGPVSGWDALTDTEDKIAALVAEGLSNPAIADRMLISRRTVQSHVSSILGKLDLTSRVELATAVARRR